MYECIHVSAHIHAQNTQPPMLFFVRVHMHMHVGVRVRVRVHVGVRVHVHVRERACILHCISASVSQYTDNTI